MKAFLLAAGLGTRLRPLTDTTPKCLVKIGDRPLLDIWLDALDRAGVDEVLVNLHHLPDEVRGHVERREAPPSVTTVFEPELLGSAGTLRANRGWVEGEDVFLVCYADNLTDFDLSKLASALQAGRADAAVAVFRAPDPSACGVVEVDANGTMVGFVEKPSQPKSNLANAGMYAFRGRVMDEVQAPSPCDIGYHLLPRLVSRAQTVLVDGYLRDIGTLAAYQAAQEEWQVRALP